EGDPFVRRDYLEQPCSPVTYPCPAKHTSFFIMAHRELRHIEQVLCDEVEHLLVIEPASYLAMNLPIVRREMDDEGPIFEGPHVGVQRPPLVGDQDHAA